IVSLAALCSGFEPARAESARPTLSNNQRIRNNQQSIFDFLETTTACSIINCILKCSGWWMNSGLGPFLFTFCFRRFNIRKKMKFRDGYKRETPDSRRKSGVEQQYAIARTNRRDSLRGNWS